MSKPKPPRTPAKDLTEVELTILAARYLLYDKTGPHGPSHHAAIGHVVIYSNWQTLNPKNTPPA